MSQRIDTTVSTGEEAVNSVSGDRGIPQVGRQKGPNKAIIALVMVAGILLALFLAAKVIMANIASNKPKETNSETAEATLPVLTPDNFGVAPAPTPLPSDAAVASPATGAAFAPAAGPAGPPALTPQQQAALDLAERRKRAPVMVKSDQSSAAGSDAGGADDQSEEEGFSNGRGSLGASLQATRNGATAARVLADPSLTITQGTFIDCILQTAINSDVPGMTSCVLSRDVYSTNGRVLLLERGSKLIGQYQSGAIRQGQKRIFLLWTRVETPKGVIVNLDSPNTDALGRAGMDGRINNHFWVRFGSAMLMSVVDDIGEFLSDRAQSNTGGDSITFDSTSAGGGQAAAIIVQNTVNIPPTLEKNQGAHVGVFVARDVYFGSVYNLAPRSR